MRIFHIQGDQFSEPAAMPEALPAAGYLWIGVYRHQFEAQVDALQTALQRLTGGQLVDLHVTDLLNEQLPSNYDYTSWYDVLVFRRLAAGHAGDPTTADRTGSEPTGADPAGTNPAGAASAADESGRDASPVLLDIDTSPIGFALFDRLLLTVHPDDCRMLDYFSSRLESQTGGTDGRTSVRMPPSAADLMLRMVNHMVDSYLDLRRQLTRELDHLQRRLFDPRSDYDSWRLLLESRNTLHLLEDTCEDQRAAITEWIDALDELPHEVDKAARRERELLRVRSRDVLEHIERVLSHVRRLESSAENAVQMHFSAQSNRTNDIMRALTVLTAIFLPLNLVTGFFGMNFEGLPLIHSAKGFWFVFFAMLLLGIGLSVYFWRKRYLTPAR